MRLRTVTTACVLAAVSLVPAPLLAQAVAKLERQLLPLQEGVLKDAPGVDGALWESLAFLRAEEERQRAVQGNITFGLTGDESGPRSLFKLNTGVALTRNAFPSEISVDSFLGLQLANGRIQEDVTSLKISYDYHATRRVEYFAFAERYSDNFLSIQQRYEVGFGARLGFDFGHIGDPAESDRQFANLRRNLRGVRAAAAALPAPAQARLQASGVLDQVRVDQALDDLEHVVHGRQTRLFVGLAASVFAEIEHAAIDVVYSSPASAGGENASAAPVNSQITIDGTQRYRLSIRPGVRLRPSRVVQIRVFPYVKLPLSGPHHVTLPDGQRRLDYRRDVLSEMTWSLRPEETGLENVDFVFTFNHFFDNVPPMLPAQVVTDAAAAGRVIDRLSGEQRHRFVSMSLRVRW
ncbi:MAG: hypothetical protein ABI868_17270 [Acidobacteriota bacterium]